MKTNVLLAFCLAVGLYACESKSSSASLAGIDGLKTNELLEPEILTELYGTWVGEYYNAEEEGYEDDYTKSTIIITRITEKVAEGKSVVKGSYRHLTGAVTKEGDGYSFVMDEPGDDKNDGQFTFTIKGDTLTGLWKAYKTNEVKNPKKQYTMMKKPFEYNPNAMLPEDWMFVDYFDVREIKEIYKNDDGSIDTVILDAYRHASDKVYKINSSTTELKEKDLKNLRKLDMEILRNTIYARHGYSFKSKRIRQFFDFIDWYVPITTEIEDKLSELEKKNIALLQRFEQYATDNYDYFGR